VVVHKDQLGDNFVIAGLMSETNELRRERETIEKEKQMLLANQKRFQEDAEPSTPLMPELPKPVPLNKFSALSRLGPRMQDREERAPDRRDLEGKWGEENDKYMDKVMDSVLKVVDDGSGGSKDRYLSRK
jgi:hypothetical protein